VIFGLGERTIVYSLVNRPVEGGKEEETFMVALAVVDKFWKLSKKNTSTIEGDA
jgi:hypothetical protein